LAAAVQIYAAAVAELYPPPAARAGNGVLDEAQLDGLVDLLRARNMAALDLFDELAPALRDHWAAERFEAVEGAVAGLAFEKAADLIALAKDQPGG
jgi:hypothetical protein